MVLHGIFFRLRQKFYDVIKQCFTTFLDATSLLFRSLFLHILWHMEAHELHFYWWIDNIFSLSLLLSASSILFFSMFFLVIVIINSAGIHKITLELLLFSTNVHWSRHVWCAVARLDEKCLITTFITPPKKKKKLFILRQNDAQKKNLHQKRELSSTSISTASFSEGEAFKA